MLLIFTINICFSQIEPTVITLKSGEIFKKSMEKREILLNNMIDKNTKLRNLKFQKSNQMGNIRPNYLLFLSFNPRQFLIEYLQKKCKRS